MSSNDYLLAAEIYQSFQEHSSLQEKIRGQRRKLGVLDGICEFHLTKYVNFT